MPAELPQTDMENAEAAVENARRVRAYHRRRTEKRSPQRRDDIMVARARLKEAMRPLKSAIGKFPYGPQTTTAEENRETIRQMSAAIQVERRKLWKMLSPEDRAASD
jgi:hypothetical protein